MSCLLRRQKLLFRVKKGFIFSAVGTGWMGVCASVRVCVEGGVNDSLMANTKRVFTGQKYDFKSFSGG